MTRRPMSRWGKIWTGVCVLTCWVAAALVYLLKGVPLPGLLIFTIVVSAYLIFLLRWADRRVP